LRNLTRGKGIGFFQTASFYPDFILWKVTNRKQKIVFVDPKGLTFIRDLDHPKINLHKMLKNEVQKTIDDPNVSLDAFIISYTPYDDVQQLYRHYHLRRTDFETDKHILFQRERKGIYNPLYVEKMFQLIEN